MSDSRVPTRPDPITFEGRVLYMTDDVELVKAQCEGQDLESIPEALIDNISTDEITPGWVCFYYDETLGEYVYTGLRGGLIGHMDVKNGGFGVLVSGKSKGCGSSRETAPYAEKWAGIQLVVAKNIEKIYGQNCQNIGLLTTTDFGLIERVKSGEPIALEEFTEGLDPIGRDIVRYGGLFPYNRARLAGEVAPPPVDTAPRPMTLVEKIIARAAIADAATGAMGIDAVKPGDALFVRTNVRFSHEYVTPMAAALFEQYLGMEAKVKDPGSVFAFRDHLTFLGQVMSAKHREMGLLERADGLATTQRAFTERQGIRLYGEVPEGGSEAICHNAVLQDLALPGEVVLGTDSHTCTAGALGTFAFGVGSTDMANSWFTTDVRVKVPETVKFILTGEAGDGITAKDVMLRILATEYIREGKAIGQVLEFAGEGVRRMPIDERATLTNMAVEAGATTGLVEADQVTVDYICANRPELQPDDIELLSGDDGAEYAAVFEIDLTTMSPMVATPGDPRNGVTIEEVGEDVKIDIAYGGSCTGGKATDMDMYASILSAALAEGKRVHEGVDLYIQFGSQKIKAYAAAKGYIEVFNKVGATLIDPSCGACIKAGPGVSTSEDQTTVSAINRNFTGRSGPGQVYLASPLVVAASAIAGRIVRP